MADESIPETPPVSAPRAADLPTVNPDGTVSTGDRPGWVWVRDVETGHRFDVRADRLPRYGMEVVPNVPVNYGRLARAAKPLVGKDGGRATPQPRPAEVASGDVARAERIEADRADARAAANAMPVERAADPNVVGRPDAALTVDTDTSTQETASQRTSEAKNRANRRN